MDIGNKKTPGVSEGILRVEHESFHQVRFSRKKGVEIPKNNVLAIFEKL